MWHLFTAFGFTPNFFNRALREFPLVHTNEMKPQFWMLLGFISQFGLIKADGVCRQDGRSVYGKFLKGHTFKTVQNAFPIDCHMICEQEARCQSYNVIIGNNICELNSRTKEASRPEDFQSDRRRFYMKRTLSRVPLGSIQELPAESCSEIKASEGKEMANSEYWIYADENGGHVIQARCQDVWQKINTVPVCFGARDNYYGAFKMTKTGRVKAMKFIHRNGSVKCHEKYDGSYWGCTNTATYPRNTLMTIITNAKGEAILPPNEELKRLTSGGCDRRRHFYSFEGTGLNSPELSFSNLSSPLSFSRNQDLQIWYGQDWVNCYEKNNSGASCVDVYAWYI